MKNKLEFIVDASGKNWSTQDYMHVLNNKLGYMSDDNKSFLFHTEKNMNRFLDFRKNRKN